MNNILLLSTLIILGILYTVYYYSNKNNLKFQEKFGDSDQDADFNDSNVETDDNTDNTNPTTEPTLDPLADKSLENITKLQNKIYANMESPTIMQLIPLINDIYNVILNMIDKQASDTNKILNSIKGTISELNTTNNILDIERASAGIGEYETLLINYFSNQEENTTNSNATTPTPTPTSTPTPTVKSTSTPTPTVKSTSTSTPTIKSTSTSTAPKSEKFTDQKIPSGFDEKYSFKLYSLNDSNEDNIPRHRIVTKKDKSLFSTTPSTPNINNYNENQPNWKLEWNQNLQDVKIDNRVKVPLM